MKKVLEEENYVPNMSARILAQNRSKIIGLIMRYPLIEGKNAIQDPFNSELIGTIEHEIRKAGYYLMIHATEDAKQILNMAVTWNVDGLIILGLGPRECAKIKKIADKPMVFIDCYFEENEEDYIRFLLQYGATHKEIDECLDISMRKVQEISKKMKGE